MAALSRPASLAITMTEGIGRTISDIDECSPDPRMPELGHEMGGFAHIAIDRCLASA
jgi:hypothetical protein